MADVGGRVLFGYCLNIFLFGILTVQIYFYYLAFPQDQRMTKSTVCFVYIIGTLQTAFALHDFYILFCTEHPTFSVYTFGFMWFTIPAGGALVAFVVQLFYAHRIYLISKARAVTTIVSILALLQFVCGIIVTVFTFGPLRSKDVLVGGISLPIGAVSGAVCDLLIAIYMSRYISRQMKGTPKATQVLVTQIGRLLLETGILTAAMSVVYAILDFFTEYGIMVPGLSLGKFYANSMLVLLNNRSTIPCGRNVPNLDTDTSSHHHSDLVGANTDPVLSQSLACANSGPAGMILPGGGICATGLNPQGQVSQELEKAATRRLRQGVFDD